MLPNKDVEKVRVMVRAKGKVKEKHTHMVRLVGENREVMRMFHAYTVLGCITNRKVVKSGSCVANVTTGHMKNVRD